MYIDKSIAISFHLLGKGRKAGEQMATIVNEVFCITVYRPNSDEVFAERYYGTAKHATSCFTEWCEEYPTSVVEYGVMTMFDDMTLDTYRVIMTRK